VVVSQKLLEQGITSYLSDSANRERREKNELVLKGNSRWRGSSRVYILFLERVAMPHNSEITS
jgi:hypothetical protein